MFNKITNSNIIKNYFNKDFLVDFILGGLIIALSGAFIKNNNSSMGGFIYGALPIGFVYLYITTYLSHNLKECRKVSYSVLFSSIIFILYVGFVCLFNDLGIFISLTLSTILTLFLMFIMYKFKDYFKNIFASLF
tara:strand:- start:373 stop:777 length:405 start_codon:yes stop_codon:yes gene_type:complete